MSYSYNRNERTTRASQPSRRGTFSYWLPLALTVTAATVGIVAWIWSERRDDDEDELPPPPESRPNYGRNPDGSIRTNPPSYYSGPGEHGYGTVPQRQEESQGYIARMSGALGRAPSPQQLFDGASRSVAAGVAAAGAVVGTALSSIREEDKNAYRDHRTWSEEAEARKAGTSVAPTGAVGSVAPIEMRSSSTPGVSSTPRVVQTQGKRKTIAIVLSAESHGDDLDEDDGYHEHAVLFAMPI